MVYVQNQEMSEDKRDRWEEAENKKCEVNFCLQYILVYTS